MAGALIQNPVIFPEDPAMIGWPPTLPLELAMRVAPVREICEAHNISRPQWDVLRHHPQFVQAVTEAQEALKKDGMSFKIKARMQSEELLKKSWAMIHDVATPAVVKADLIKFTIKAAGLDSSKDASNGPQNALQINIDLGDR